jgi:hypothetical protein
MTSVPFGTLALQSVRLQYRNSPPKQEGVSSLLFDVLFWLFAFITVLGSGYRFIARHQATLWGMPFENPVLRLVVMLVVGYAALAQSLFLFKAAAWLLYRPQ